LISIQLVLPSSLILSTSFAQLFEFNSTHFAQLFDSLARFLNFNQAVVIVTRNELVHNWGIGFPVCCLAFQTLGLNK
jgi:hypothetical protein